ncbi:MAG: frataxin domain-containing protein [Pseudomonadota bacterium]
MHSSILQRITTEIEQYPDIEIQESNNMLYIFSTQSKHHDIQIDYRESIHSIWISSLQYGAYQFYLNKGQWINNKNENLNIILSNILQQEIKNFNRDKFIHKLQLL